MSGIVNFADSVGIQSIVQSLENMEWIALAKQLW
jgi:hypothetical protein